MARHKSKESGGNGTEEAVDAVSTMSAKSICIGMSRSLISDGMRARSMTANGWRARFGAPKASGCAILSQSLKC